MSQWKLDDQYTRQSCDRTTFVLAFLMPNFELLIATRNPGKIGEIQNTLKDLPLSLHVLEDYPEILVPFESGASYEENAGIKARSYASQTGLWALADDSGLEVAALDGAPGLRSARFGGAQTSDSERITLLLERMSEAGMGARLASFVCVVAIAEPTGGVIHIARGTCVGRIATTPVGGTGFGFDPVFIPDGYDMTFAEMPTLLKNKISHRANALAATRRFLEKFLEVVS